MKGVLLDSSFLMEVAEIGKDVIAFMDDALGVTLPKFTLNLVIEEMENIRDRGSSKRSSMARVALGLAQRMKIIEEAPLLPVDDAIIDVARHDLLVVATNDMDLRRRLREARIPVVYVKDGFLKVEGMRGF